MSRAGTVDRGARIKRGTAPRKRQPAGRLPAPVRKKQAQALALMPPRWKAAARRAGGWLLVIALIAAVGAGFVAMRLPQMLGMEAGELLGDAGFRVQQVEVPRLGRVSRDTIVDATLAGERAMPLVDLEEVRRRVLAIGRAPDAAGWVAAARVSRRWPDTLVVDITERRPAAIWQYRRQLMLVDASGLPIERMKLGGPPLGDLPTVIGEGANRHLAELETLLAAAPALKPVFDGATWRGNRRWDIRFKSGETLMLPEGAARAKAALVRFVNYDSQGRLLGQGNPLFDMRNDKLVWTRGKPPPRSDAAPAPPSSPAPTPQADADPAGTRTT